MKFDIGDKVIYRGRLLEVNKRQRDSRTGQVSYSLWDTGIEEYNLVPEEDIAPYNIPFKLTPRRQFNVGEEVDIKLGNDVFTADIVEIEKSADPITPYKTRYKVQLVCNNQLIWIDPCTIVGDSDPVCAYKTTALDNLAHGIFKSRPDWIPADVILGMGDVLAWGKSKYPGNDWKTMSPDLHLAAAQRHLLKHAKGEQSDEESGMNHLYHSMVRLAFYVHLTSSSGA